MTIERAIEILDPEHREPYDNLRTIREAYYIGMEAMKKQIPAKPEYEYTEKCIGFFHCRRCHAAFDRDAWHVRYCWRCGQAVKWYD